MHPEDVLTDREIEVFRLVAQGWTSRQIAAALSISERTVELHRLQTRRKLGLPAARIRSATNEVST